MLTDRKIGTPKQYFDGWGKRKYLGLNKSSGTNARMWQCADDDTKPFIIANLNSYMFWLY